MEITLSEHAQFEMKRRGVPLEVLEAVVKNPAETVSSRHGRVVLQGMYHDGHLGKEMLLRVVGVYEGDSFRVITLYKTSKLEKYLSTGGPDEGAV